MQILLIRKFWFRREISFSVKNVFGDLCRPWLLHEVWRYVLKRIISDMAMKSRVCVSSVLWTSFVSSSMSKSQISYTEKKKWRKKMTICYSFKWWLLCISSVSKFQIGLFSCSRVIQTRCASILRLRVIVNATTAITVVTSICRPWVAYPRKCLSKYVNLARRRNVNESSFQIVPPLKRLEGVEKKNQSESKK